jgi:hypothetical protein
MLAPGYQDIHVHRVGPGRPDRPVVQATRDPSIPPNQATASGGETSQGSTVPHGTEPVTPTAGSPRDPFGKPGASNGRSQALRPLPGPSESVWALGYAGMGFGERGAPFRETKCPLSGDAVPPFGRRTTLPPTLSSGSILFGKRGSFTGVPPLGYDGAPFGLRTGHFGERGWALTENRSSNLADRVKRGTSLE